MKLKIITQERVVFDEEVDEIYSKGIDGEFGLLKGHIPMMTALDIERAKSRLRNANARLDAKRAEAAIARAEARLKAKLAK